MSSNASCVDVKYDVSSRRHNDSSSSLPLGEPPTMIVSLVEKLAICPRVCTHTGRSSLLYSSLRARIFSTLEFQGSFNNEILQGTLRSSMFSSRIRTHTSEYAIAERNPRAKIWCHTQEFRDQKRKLTDHARNGRSERDSRHLPLT